MNIGFSKYVNNKIKTLEKAINKEIQKVLLEVGDMSVDLIRKYLAKEWYGTYNPKSYERTYDLLESARYTIKGNKVIVYLDRRLFGTPIVNNGKGWQPHRGFDGEDFVTGLIEWIDSGIGDGGSIKNPRRYDGGIEFVDYVQNEINEYISRVVDRKISAVIKSHL